MTTAVATDLEAHLAQSPACLARHATDDEIAAALAEMVAHRDYPCLGARSVFRRDAAEIAVLPNMAADDLVATLGERLRTFAAEHGDSEDLVSFIAVFRDPVAGSEREFETSLWRVLQELHDRDDTPWPGDVASDPSDPRFAFAFSGTPYFIVGLHPAASRIARRAPLPTMVFNLHRQFERLRSDGTFARMRTAIRRREERLQGSVNPMMDDYGSSSAARQYSGRAVEIDWRAPFAPRGARG
ncbi:MAG: guanitoxin biosynthesis heme-dependent pre-guanitoxin N-hydroxylase GntA [Dermatophilaceae bacterium]